jgi:hypothetical protein
MYWKLDGVFGNENWSQSVIKLARSAEAPKKLLVQKLDFAWKKSPSAAPLKEKG